MTRSRSARIRAAREERTAPADEQPTAARPAVPAPTTTPSRRARRVKLNTLLEGATFYLPGSGRHGVLLRPCSTSGALVRLWATPEERAEDIDTPDLSKPIRISAEIDVVPT